MISANVPKPGTASTLVGAARREFRMQIGRRSTWIVTGLLAAILLISAVPHWDPANTLAADMGIYALLFNILVPVVIGSLLADRVVPRFAFSVWRNCSTASRPRVPQSRPARQVRRNGRRVRSCLSPRCGPLRSFAPPSIRVGPPSRWASPALRP